MDNKDIYKRMLCKAKSIRSNSTVHGFLELDEDKNKWCMCVMMDKDCEYTSDIEDMHQAMEYVEIDQDTIEFIDDYICKEEVEKETVKTVIDLLSYSELDSAQYIFKELDGNKEFIMTPSLIASEIGTSRSVIINTLRKFESYGIINTKMLGMKGIHIAVLNNNVFTELESRK